MNAALLLRQLGPLASSFRVVTASGFDAGGLGIVPGSAGATAVRGSLGANTQRGFDAAGRFVATGQAF